MKYNAEDYTYEVIGFIEESDMIEDFLKRASDYLQGNWKIRKVQRDPKFFGLDVKGKGFGDYNKVNKNNRWEEMGVGIDEYYDIISDENEQIFFEWDRIFSDNFGLDLAVQGRSDGYWGFTIEDLTDFDYVLELNKDVLQSVLNRIEKDGVDLDEEHSISDTIIDSMSEDELDNLIEFKPKLLKTLNEFTNAIYEASDYRETDDYAEDIFGIGMDIFM